MLKAYYTPGMTHDSFILKKKKLYEGGFLQSLYSVMETETQKGQYLAQSHKGSLSYSKQLSHFSWDCLTFGTENPISLQTLESWDSWLP